MNDILEQPKIKTIPPPSVKETRRFGRARYGVFGALAGVVGAFTGGLATIIPIVIGFLVSFATGDGDDLNLFDVGSLSLVTVLLAVVASTILVGPPAAVVGACTGFWLQDRPIEGRNAFAVVFAGLVLVIPMIYIGAQGEQELDPAFLGFMAVVSIAAMAAAIATYYWLVGRAVRGIGS